MEWDGKVQEALTDAMVERARASSVIERAICDGVIRGIMQIVRIHYDAREADAMWDNAQAWSANRIAARAGRRATG